MALVRIDMSFHYLPPCKAEEGKAKFYEDRLTLNIPAINKSFESKFTQNAMTGSWSYRTGLNSKLYGRLWTFVREWKTYASDLARRRILRFIITETQIVTSLSKSTFLDSDLMRLNTPSQPEPTISAPPPSLLAIPWESGFITPSLPTSRTQSGQASTSNQTVTDSISAPAFSQWQSGVLLPGSRARQVTLEEGQLLDEGWKSTATKRRLEDDGSGSDCSSKSRRISNNTATRRSQLYEDLHRLRQQEQTVVEELRTLDAPRPEDVETEEGEGLDAISSLSTYEEERQARVVLEQDLTNLKAELTEPFLVPKLVDAVLLVSKLAGELGRTSGT